MATMLLDLPAEILVAIAEQLTAKRDLKHTCQVSTRLYDIVTPILYKAITIEADEEVLEHIDALPLLKARSTPRSPLRHVQNIEFTSRFHTNTRCRCVHGKTEDPLVDYREHLDFEDCEGDEADENEHTVFAYLASTSLALLEGCKDDSLRSFTWALGTCIPPGILGPYGYLPLKQTRLEALHLITGGSCQRNTRYANLLSLYPFTHVKILSWRGLRSEGDFESLNDLLEINCHQITELELDLVAWARVLPALDIVPLYNFFAWEVLGLLPADKTLMFPALVVLSLTAVSFLSAPEEMSHAFSIRSLRSLTLRSCPGWQDFLLHSTRMNPPTALKSLELHSTVYHPGPPAEETTILDFLDSFEGLEQFAICTGPMCATLDLWRALRGHEATLRAFVHHQRNLNLNVVDSPLDEECDLDDLWLSLFHMEIGAWRDDASLHPFNRLKLEFLGLCCVPRSLKDVLSPLATTNNALRILHIRQSGSDINRSQTYPSWATRIRRASRDRSDADVESVSDTPMTFLTDQPRQSSGRRAGDVNGPVELTEHFHDLAQWAFGPEGLSSLRVIAYGDFSHKGRYARSNLFLSRNVGARRYRVHRHEDMLGGCLGGGELREERELVCKYVEMLEACPIDPLFED